MLELLGIVLFALLIGASIAAHELGHLIPAKAFGVKVTEYMIGFGPTVWSKVKGETRWGVKLVPLGGYIRMIGMIPPGRGGDAGNGRFATMIADARRASLEEVGPDDGDRVFYRLPVRKRVIIMLGGPTMNLILAFVLFAAVLVGIGQPQPTLSIADVVACTPTATQEVVPTLPSGACPTSTTQAPAAAAGIQPGDSIVSVAGVPAADWAAATAWIWAHPQARTTITVERGGELLELPITIQTIQRPAYDADGVPTGETFASGFIGIRPEMAYVPAPWSAVPEYMWSLTTASVSALIGLPVELYHLVVDTLIGGGERALDGPVSVVGVSRIGGEVAAMDEPLRAKAATFLGLAASLNLFLFLFNLIPVLPLDGGHVAGALYEAIRRAWAKLWRKPDPGPVDTARLLPIAYIVAGCLLAMGVIVIWADLVKPITLG